MVPRPGADSIRTSSAPMTTIPSAMAFPRFRSGMACAVRLKLWDEEQGRLVKFAGLRTR